MKLSRWARATLVIGAILLVLGIVPLWLSASFLPGGAPPLFALAFYLLTPPGALIFGLGALLFLISLLKN